MNTFIPFKKFNGALIPDCLMEFNGLSDGAKILWGKLSEMAGKKGYCYPSQELLAAKISKGIRQTKRLIAELEDEGFILIQHSTKIGQNNTYYFIEHKIFLSDINDTQHPVMSDINDTRMSDINDTQEVSDMSLSGVSDMSLLYNEVKGSSLKGSSLKGSCVLKGSSLKGSKDKESKPGADAPVSARKGSKRIKPDGNDMAGEIEKLKGAYPSKYRDLIDQAIKQFALTRKDHAIAESVIWGFITGLEKFELWQIGQGVRQYIRKGCALEGKNEKYCMGIIRGQAKNNGEFSSADKRLTGGYSSSLSSQTPPPPPVKRQEEIDFRGNPLKGSFRKCGQTGHLVDWDEWDAFLVLREQGLIKKGEFYRENV